MFRRPQPLDSPQVQLGWGELHSFQNFDGDFDFVSRGRILGAKQTNPATVRGMKKCTYCGKQYPDDALRCDLDRKPLVAYSATPEALAPGAISTAAVSATASVSSFLPNHPDLLQVAWAFTWVEGYSRPNWKRIGEAIRNQVPPEDQRDAWTEAAVQWLEQVRGDLGGQYSIRSSDRFVLLSELASNEAANLLSFAELTLDRIHLALADAAWKTGLGKHVILLFTEDDDYLQYVAYFDRDGVHPASAGCLIHWGYVHIAIPRLAGHHIRSTLAHELAHNCVAHLGLPLWLNEGLAVTFSRATADGRHPLLDHDLRTRHLAFWNPATIQKFWSGASFHEAGDSNELSYNLAEIVVHLLLESQQQFGAFVEHAQWADAGQTAALDFLGKDLGVAMATFLGEGNWRPNRKAMVECWNAAQRSDNSGVATDLPSPDDQKPDAQAAPN